MSSTVAAVLLCLIVGAAPAAAADSGYERGVKAGNGSTALATSPPAAPDSEPSAMPRTTAQRVRTMRPEAIVAVLIGLMLVTGAVLGVRMLVGVFRHR